MSSKATLAGLVILVLSLATVATGTGQSTYTVYFYSPETNINNFSSLKSAFDTYLLDQGGYRFQPFSDRDVFEEVIKSSNDGLFLLSSWHYQRLAEDVALEPLLVGARGRESTQKRVLSGGPGIGSLDALSGVTLASAGTEEFTTHLLRQMMPAEQVASIRILVVPKDIDAIMAVSFGQSKAALTTQATLLKAAEINPKLASSLTSLATSTAVLLPVIAAHRDRDAALDRLAGVMEKMGSAEEGARRLRMLGFDGFHKLDEKERRILEP